MRPGGALCSRERNLAREAAPAISVGGAVPSLVWLDLWLSSLILYIADEVVVGPKRH